MTTINYREFFVNHAFNAGIGAGIAITVFSEQLALHFGPVTTWDRAFLALAAGALFFLSLYAAKEEAKP